VERHAVITDPAILSLRVDESLYFANARHLEDRIYAEVAARPALRHVVLMCPAVNLIDASALESLEAIADRLRAAGVGFHLSEVKGPVMDALKRSDFFEHFKGQVFLSQFEAVRVLARETEAGAMVTTGQAAAPSATLVPDGKLPASQGSDNPITAAVASPSR
jgi:SulP family sulfate permease